MRQEVAAYPYRDEQGVTLYEEVRFEDEKGPKSFAFRRPDPDRPGHTLWGLGQVRRILYRLPELLANPAWPVVLVEGAGKAEVLAALGLHLCPTAMAGGVGMGWLDCYSKTLTDRRVVILPDNDPAGFEHAYSAAGSLLAHDVASLRLVVLPGLAEKEDVKDWLAAGYTAEDLVAVIRETPEWRPAQRHVLETAC